MEQEHVPSFSYDPSRVKLAQTTHASTVKRQNLDRVWMDSVHAASEFGDFEVLTVRFFLYYRD